MHIAHFTNTYYPVTSGVVRSLSSFRQALTELGHNVFIFAQHAGDYEDSEPFIFRYPAIDLPRQEYPLTIPVSPFVEKLLPPLKLDVIHAHHPALLGQVASRKATELDVPLVFTHHTRYQEYSHYVSLPQELVKDVITRWLADYMEHCQHIVVPSESIKKLLMDLYGIKERVTVVPTGIDLRPYATAERSAVRQQKRWGDDIVLISVGRLAGEKNWGMLLTAVQPVMQQHHKVRLVILGDGDERSVLEKQARKLGIAERLEMPGMVPFSAVPGYLKAADIFCFASVTETQGLVTLEAMAAGLPVVAIDAMGTTDAVTDGVEGLLTSNESQALSQAIEQLVTDESLRRQFGQAALHRAREFEISRQARKLLAVYEQAIEDKKAGFVITADKHKPIFKIEWRELLGLS